MQMSRLLTDQNSTSNLGLWYVRHIQLLRQIFYGEKLILYAGPYSTYTSFDNSNSITQVLLPANGGPPRFATPCTSISKPYAFVSFAIPR